MASATQAFSEAFSSYRSLLVDYAVYSVVLLIASTVLSFFIALCLGIFGIVSVGSVANLFTADGSIGVAAVGMSVSLLALLVALLLVLWVSSGLQGAYFATINGLLSKRKQTVGGFALLVPRHATSIMIISIICGVVVGAPFAVLVALMPALGQILSIAAALLLLLYVLIAVLLLLFAIPAVVLDSKGPFSAIKASAVTSSRNLPQAFLYLVAAFVLGIPGLVPFFNLFYVPLFYLPLVSAALLCLYKSAR
jgi:hypothetical protein